jgi:hypothetical protein
MIHIIIPINDIVLFVNRLTGLIQIFKKIDSKFVIYKRLKNKNSTKTQKTLRTL